MKNTIDLLTVEEAEKLPVEILQCKAPSKYSGFMINDKRSCYWWLKTHGFYDSYSPVVEASGCIHENGYNIKCDYIGVRPVLRLEDKSFFDGIYEENGFWIYLETKWIDISEYVGSPCLLKKKCLKNSRRFDGKSKNYDESEIKDFIEKWYEKKLKKYCVEEDENVFEPVTVQFTCNNISIKKPITEAFCNEVKYEAR